MYARNTKDTLRIKTFNMAKYNPECNHCACYLQYNEAFELFCNNPECPTKQLTKSEQQYYNQMLQDNNMEELERLDNIIIKQRLALYDINQCPKCGAPPGYLCRTGCEDIDLSNDDSSESE